MAAAGAAPTVVKSTSSPTVLMSRPPWAVMTSAESASKRETSRARSRSDIRRTSAVKLTRSAKPTERIFVRP